jgi:hypothetical protein
MLCVALVLLYPRALKTCNIKELTGRHGEQQREVGRPLGGDNCLIENLLHDLQFTFG